MTRQKIHHIIYILSLLLLAASIPVSNFGMSLGGIILAANWVIEGDFRNKWLRLKQQPSVWVFVGFVAVFALGLFRTDNWNAGLTNLLSKMPLLYAPIAMASSKELDRKSVLLILSGFIISTFVGSVVSGLYYITAPFIGDMREISRFISHIRFSLCVDMSIVLTSYLLAKAILPKWGKVLLLLLDVWFAGYLFFAQTLTGIVIIFLIGIFFAVYTVIATPSVRLRRWVLWLVGPLMLATAAYVGVITYQYFHVSTDNKVITSTVTSQGNTYTFDDTSVVENGNYTGMYLCEQELRETWPLRSAVPYDSVAPTLIRYLNSKGLHKDAEAVAALTDKDVENVEHRIANVDYTQHFGLKRALYPTFFSMTLYFKYHHIGNSSLMERVELWHAAWLAIQEHWLLGVGVGDHKAAIDQQLVQTGSPLAVRLNRGAHNQFLTFWLMGGLLVLIYFVCMLFYPFVRMKTKVTLVYVSFFIIVFASMFTEDTIETSAGMTLFAFFNYFLLYIFNTEQLENGKQFTIHDA